jgi:murein DD-endopeptidase MepM/ murein hydrolase activator NlpD
MDRLKEKIFKGAGEQKNLLSYDQKSLNIMKTKITQADKAELENLLLMIQRGEDPVKEDTTSTPLDDATKVDNANIATAAPTLAKIDAMIDGCKYTFPLVGMATLTSGFGPRIHPITGKNDMHTGIDLATNE